MEIQTRVCDDEAVLLDRGEVPPLARRSLPAVCTMTLLALAGAGARAGQTSSHLSAVVSMSSDPVGCSHDGDDCRHTGCCVQAGNRCFRKNSHWASCNETCNPYQKWDHDRKQWSTEAERVWDCTMIVAQAAQPPAVAPTVEPATPATTVAPAAGTPSCAFDGDDCRLSGCCARAGSTCYVKNDHWASCNETCLPFSKWSHHHGHWVHTSHREWDCSSLTAPLVPASSTQALPNTLGSNWGSNKAVVYQGCPEDGHDCRDTRCCARRGSRCYVKNDHWASCNETCTPYTKWDGPHGQGSWKRMDYPVWRCDDITVDGEAVAQE